jgi:hypothetical protein
MLYDQYLMSTCLCSRKMFAVGGRGCFPKIYVYSYPDKHVLHVLAGGSERGYANMSFSFSGTTLASLSSSPDYMLTVWNWLVVWYIVGLFGCDVVTICMCGEFVGLKRKWP